MFFASAASGGHTSWFATHPPIVDRIKAVDRHFRAELEFTAQLRGSGTESADAGKGMVAGFAGSVAPGAGAPSKAGTLSAEDTVRSIGNPTAEHVAYSQHLLQQLPANLKSAVRDAFSARAVIYCLLLSKDGVVRREQAPLRPGCSHTLSHGFGRESTRIREMIGNLQYFEIC